MSSVHFIGIGGVGMNGLAQLALLRGMTVSGSDRSYAPEKEPFKTLERMGVRFFPQDGSGITEKTEQVVFSTAIEEDNPDLKKAQLLNTPLLHRAAFLAELVKDEKLIAVAGTAGKTTTTAMVGWIFEQLGEDPSVYNGAPLPDWKTEQNLGNVRLGRSGFWIIEADESDRSFLQFSPTHAIITNISRDHYELDELYRMFDQFSAQTSGVVIKGDELTLVQGKAPNSFCFQGIEFSVSLPGRHNMQNALCAVALCAELGLDLEKVRLALKTFGGVERRLERVGEARSVVFFDDYAHNAAKIRAALSAAMEGGRRVHAFWRPHGFTPLFNGMEDLISTFSEVQPESLFILPVYYAGGTVDRKATASDLVKKLQQSGISATLVSDYSELEQELANVTKPGDWVLGMGARDPELPLFPRRVIEQWNRNDA